eukprot:15433098-Alexandrium_andersonii.AAC.1
MALSPHPDGAALGDAAGNAALGEVMAASHHDDGGRGRVGACQPGSGDCSTPGLCDPGGLPEQLGASPAPEAAEELPQSRPFGGPACS